MPSEKKKRNPAVPVRCMECGKRWLTRNPLPQCSSCNSVDIESADEGAFGRWPDWHEGKK